MKNMMKIMLKSAKLKFYEDGEEGRKALGMANCSINIWFGLELELAWSKKSSSYFENSFPIFLLSGILNRSIFKVRDVLLQQISK